MKIFLPILFSLLLLLTGCNLQPELTTKSSDAQPSWVDNPNQDGKNGAVGIAGRTYDQKPSSQRKLAITRALDELTMQQGVKVQMAMTKEEVVQNDRANTHFEQKSNYDATATVTAHIQEAWTSPLSGDVYIWMVLD